MRHGGGATGALSVSPSLLAELLAATLPDEELSAAELEATLFDDPDGAVLGSADGAVGVAVRGDVGFVTVLVVAPERQRHGVGRSLLDVAHRWLEEREVGVVHTGAAAPRYLWPGVDVEAHAGAVSLFGAAGYEPVTSTHNHRVPTGFRAPAPDGVEVRRASVGSAEAGRVVAFAAASFPAWVDEVERALPHG